MGCPCGRSRTQRQGCRLPLLAVCSLLRGCCGASHATPARRGNSGRRGARESKAVVDHQSFNTVGKRGRPPGRKPTIGRQELGALEQPLVSVGSKLNAGMIALNKRGEGTTTRG